MSSGKGRVDVRIPVITDLQLNNFAVGEAESIGSYILNGIVGKYGQDEYYVQQRPSFRIFNDPGDYSVTDTAGRAVYYHATADKLYFINNDTMYYDTYTNTMTLATVATHSADTTDAVGPTSGYKRMYTARLGNDVFFLSPQDNNGFYVRGATSYTVLYDMGAGAGEHTSDDFTTFPPNNSLSLAHGCAVLDQTLYVLTTNGQIWGSTIGNGKSWTDALNFLTAETDEDAGLYLAKHHDTVVCFGRRTIEFFYNAANPTGSPLSRRNDIQYNIGLADPESVWQHGDDIYFLGIDHVGAIIPYRLRGFKLEPLSNSSVSSYFGYSKSQDSMLVMGAGISAGTESYWILSVYNEISSVASVVVTYVYNTTSGIWTEWQFSEASMSNFPLVGFTITDDDRIGEGITQGGQLIWCEDNFNPFDGIENLGGNKYVADGYVAAGYVETTGIGTTNYEAIQMKIRIDNYDNGNRNWKFWHQARVVCDETVSTNNMTVRWNDNESVGSGPAYTGTRTINLSSAANKLTRLGKSKSRAFELDYQGTEQIRIKGIDVTFSQGT